MPCRVAAQESPSEAVGEALGCRLEAEAAADLPFLRENVMQAFDRCVDGLGRVSSIVSSIREFAHPARPEMAPVDLNRAIANTLTIARNEYVHVAELETDLCQMPPVMCHIDQINLQVVLNLIVNAAHAIGDVFKSSGTKGQLCVRTRLEGADVVISVSDTGPGIPEAIREHIFDPFFTTKDVGKGTGQGLALAWKLVTEKHGGTLTYETVLGKGTTFFARLPFAGKTQALIGAARDASSAVRSPSLGAPKRSPPSAVSASADVSASTKSRGVSSVLGATTNSLRGRRAVRAEKLGCDLEEALRGDFCERRGGSPRASRARSRASSHRVRLPDAGHGWRSLSRPSLESDSPSVIRILLSGAGAENVAIDEPDLVFRFLSKPCPRETLVQVIEMAWLDTPVGVA